MSRYGYLVCHTCKRDMFIGKAVYEDESKVGHFHVGNADKPFNWEQPELNQVLWKILADHVDHRLGVHIEGSHIQEEEAWVTIGGDADTDISFKDYLKNWKGLRSDEGVL